MYKILGTKCKISPFNIVSIFGFLFGCYTIILPNSFWLVVVILLFSIILFAFDLWMQRSKVRYIKLIVIEIAALVIISNITIGQWVSGWQWYKYTSRDGNYCFNEFPAKGSDLDRLERDWVIYKAAQHPRDSNIYRTFAIKPLKFWLWESYIFNKRYRYPYIDPAIVPKGCKGNLIGYNKRVIDKY